ncbi:MULTISPECIES: hypothetical protein [unclassified Mycobacterium]|uniref:hypothetical protein n=1 Tax=unclassified Mycobacterium TaxID=2642494 RepID=UPI0012E34A61|nr:MULTISPECIES: hypothetical protein [unclassified Mycobacterium]
MEEAEQQLQVERDRNLKARLDAVTRHQYEEGSAAERERLAAAYAKATSVQTVGSVWRLTMARYMFLHAAAQLRKCVVGLRELGVDMPELPDEKLIRILRDVDDHWEQVEEGRSLKQLRELRPGDRPTRVVYGAFGIQVGGISTAEIVNWARRVDAAVRANAQAEGQQLVDRDEPVDFGD